MIDREKIIKIRANRETVKNFPKFVDEIKKIGIKTLTICLHNGSMTYIDESGNELVMDMKNGTFAIEKNVNISNFTVKLKNHQSGKTDFLTFCQDCGTNGVCGWIINTNAMTCTYLSLDKCSLLVESIPAV